MTVIRIAVASACVLASLLPVRSLVLRGNDTEWEQWLEMTSHKPPWDDTKSPQRVVNPGPKLRVAVFCSGALKRFFLQETASGLIAPMVREGHQVDYYVALNVADFKSFHVGADTLVTDPELANKKIDTVRHMITGSIEEAGGRAKVVDLFDGISVDSSKDQAWLWRRDNMMRAKENVLKKVKPLQVLYEKAEMFEREAGQQYDMMIFLDDDSIWLQPFSLSNLLKITANQKEDQVFTLRCGVNSTTITPASGFLTEYIFVANRTVSESLGKQYTLLTGSKHGHKVWNLEQFSFRVTQKNANNIQVYPAAIPMQRGGRLAMNGGGVQVCLHKKCVSPPEADPHHLARLNPFDYYPVCNEALWK